MSVRSKRIYEPAHERDGTRVLIDRLWPRGLAKADARIDHWLKEIAPSNELRRWYGHEPARWSEFRKRYRAELDANPQALSTLLELARGGTVTLLYASRENELNNATALQEYVESRLGPAG